MSKKIKLEKNIMEHVNAAVKAIQDKGAQTSICVGKNKAANAPADKLVCMISCINTKKESLELAFNVDTPKDFVDADEPYLALTVNAESFTQQVGALLLRGSDVTLTEEKSAVKLFAGSAASKVSLVEESDAIRAARAEVIFKNDEMELNATLSSKKVRTAIERCLSAVNPAVIYEVAKGVTFVADGSNIHLYGFDNKMTQHTVITAEEGAKFIDRKEGGSRFAISATVAKTLCLLTAGGKNFLLGVSPTKGCIAVRPAENMTLRYTFPLASARLSDSLIAQIGTFENDNCVSRVVVDGEQIKGAVKFVSATNSKGDKVPAKVSIGTKSLTFTQGDAKVSIDLVEQDGSEQMEKYFDIALLNTALTHEGNGNILFSAIEKGAVSIRGGDLENASNSVAVVLPLNPPKQNSSDAEEE